MDDLLPLVSIVMPCFNALAFLDGSVGSILAQTFENWELIAVDDGSSDGTLAWLQAVGDPRVHAVHQDNGGVSSARNKGIERARGRFIAFLDADDRWDARFLQRMTQALDSRPDAVLAYCGWQNVGRPGPAGAPYVPPDIECTAKRETLFAGCQWPIHAALVQREAVVAAGGFDTSLQNAEDYALWLSIGTTGALVRVPEVLAYYIFHSETQASRHRARAALQFFAVQQRYLARHPEFMRTLGTRRCRDLTVGTLMHRGFECYWADELDDARLIFTTVMRHWYGQKSDWRLMLPSWLPLRWHAALIRMMRNRQETPS